jgi:hypothetical protein
MGTIIVARQDYQVMVFGGTQLIDDTATKLDS